MIMGRSGRWPALCYKLEGFEVVGEAADSGAAVAALVG
jgi:hypothetical protein